MTAIEGVVGQVRVAADDRVEVTVGVKDRWGDYGRETLTYFDDIDGAPRVGQRVRITIEVDG